MSDTHATPRKKDDAHKCKFAKKQKHAHTHIRTAIVRYHSVETASLLLWTTAMAAQPAVPDDASSEMDYSNIVVLTAARHSFGFR